MSTAEKRKAGGNPAPEKGSELVPQEHGGAIYQGPPKNPVAGPGRPPDEFKRRMAELASSDEALAYLGECLRGEHGAKPAISAHKHVSERGYGKAPQDVNVKGAMGITVKVEREA